jgi:hypothetical protein
MDEVKSRRDPEEIVKMFLQTVLAAAGAQLRCAHNNQIP